MDATPMRQRATFSGQPVCRDEMVKVRKIVVHEGAMGGDWEWERDDNSST